MKLTFEEYKSAVVKQARMTYNKPICIDTIKTNYTAGVSVENAVIGVILDSQFWNGDLMP